MHGMLVIAMVQYTGVAHGAVEPRLAQPWVRRTSKRPWHASTEILYKNRGQPAKTRAGGTYAF